MPAQLQGTPSISTASGVANISGTSPPGIASGEILVAHLNQRFVTSGLTPALTPPSGWTTPIWVGSSTNGNWVSFKLNPTPSESLTYTWTSDKANADVSVQICVIHRISGADTSSEPDVYRRQVNATVATIDFPAPSGNTTVDGALLMALGA